MKWNIVFLACAMVLSGCARRATLPDTAATPALTRLGGYHFKVTTASPAAQQAFDRGLAWTHGFGYHAAEQEFRQAAEADPTCAMAYWGMALVNGPHINFPLVPPDRAARAWDAISRARELARGCTPREQALINALATRYAHPQPENRAPLDEAYAAAMRELWKQYPNDADIGTLCAEALMDLHPWDLWSGGEARPWTPEIVAILERVLALNLQHPGANHLYIHAVEASPEPDKALAAANRLRGLVPDSGHLVHMPSHIFARVGDWEQGAAANRAAMQADARYREVYPRPGFYAMYMAHNSHFLAFTGMMRGRSEETLAVARRVVAEVPEEFLDEYGAVADGFLVFVPEVLMRFGRWEEILQEPKPRRELPYSQAMWRWVRAVAFTALDRMPEARAERERFLEAKAKVPAEAAFGNNSASDLLEIAVRVLDGEMLAQEGKLEASAAILTEAVAREDRLRYDEPPDWIQPVRHTLGAVLLRAGKPAEAEAVYRADLAIWRENGWSLMGLRDALQAQGRAPEAREADARLRKAWANADVKPDASCYCQAGKIAKR